jgi:ABC-type amino acid transport system permease subunit
MTTAQAPVGDPVVAAVTTAKQKGRLEAVIEMLAGGLGNTIGWMAESGVLFAIFAMVWVAFGIGLVLSQGSVDQAWNAIRDLPLIVQGVIWLLFLPVMIGLWIWESTWPLLVRLILVAGVAGWNLLVFLPKAAQAAKE